MKNLYKGILAISLVILMASILSKLYIDCYGNINKKTQERPNYCQIQKDYTDNKEVISMPKKIDENFIFECKVQKFPELSPETQILYKYAYYHDVHNLWDPKEGVWGGLAKYYRIAAANGDYKANVRLQYLLQQDYIKVFDPREEIFNLNEELVKQLPATAYYKTYGHVNNGRFNTEEYGQFAFLRRAAKLGSGDAQFELSNKLMDIEDEPTFEMRLKFADKLEDCAAENGQPRANVFASFRKQREQKHQEALYYVHNSVRYGYSSSAQRLSTAFKIKTLGYAIGSEDFKKDDLNVEEDLERSRRYQLISDYLFDNEHLNPKVPDLDEIVPLPPAKLPAWDGKIEFQRWYEGPSPEKPSDALMEKLAKAKGLDPKTGLPLVSK